MHNGGFICCRAWKTSAFIQIQVIHYSPAFKISPTPTGAELSTDGEFSSAHSCVQTVIASSPWIPKNKVLYCFSSVWVVHCVLPLREKGAVCNCKTITVNELLVWCFCRTWYWDALGSSKMLIRVTKQLYSTLTLCAGCRFFCFLSLAIFYASLEFSMNPYFTLLHRAVKQSVYILVSWTLLISYVGFEFKPALAPEQIRFFSVWVWPFLILNFVLYLFLK